MDDDTRCDIETSRKCFLNEKNKMQMHKFQKRGENDNNNIDDDKKKKNCAAAKMQTRNGRRLRVGIFGRAQRYIFRATIEICCSLNTKMTLKKPISIS